MTKQPSRLESTAAELWAGEDQSITEMGAAETDLPQSSPSLSTGDLAWWLGQSQYHRPLPTAFGHGMGSRATVGYGLYVGSTFWRSLIISSSHCSW